MSWNQTGMISGVFLASDSTDSGVKQAHYDVGPSLGLFAGFSIVVGFAD